MWAADTNTVFAATGACDACVNQVQGGKGWLGVIGGGFDYQFTSNIVAGVFADFNISSLKGTIQDEGPFFAGDIKQTSSWAVGARGMASDPNGHELFQRRLYQRPILQRVDGQDIRRRTDRILHAGLHGQWRVPGRRR